MKTESYWGKVRLGIFTVLCMVWTLNATLTEVAAAPLGMGDYALTSGVLAGSTFSIGATGLFTAWNLTFPATVSTPTTNFFSLAPAPAINNVDANRNRISFDTSGIQHELNTSLINNGAVFYGWGQLNLNNNNAVIASGTGVGTPVPEPASAALLASGLLGLAGYRWSQRRRERVHAG